ncbi:MAG: hypothetical protein EXS32_12555 [Opitutus sp.]|nr:hypothetical protein [Opitutus sp.]
MQKILVLRGGALGDFIVTLPALALLRQRWPAARVELVGNVTAAALVLATGAGRNPARPGALLDAAHSQHEARWSALFSAAPLPGDFATWLASFDLVLNFWPDPGGELRRRFPLHPGQTFLAAQATPERTPAAAHFCEPLRTVGLATADFFVALRVSGGDSSPTPTHRAAADSPLMAIHPGSGSPRKNWPLERWLELLDWLPSPGLVVLGEAEIERWSALSSTRLVRGLTEQRVGRHTLQLAVDLPLPELGAHLSRCRLFLGHDSGISHLAAACSVPSILLFGPTDPAMWAPPAPQVRVIKRGEELTSISVADVRALL